MSSRWIFILATGWALSFLLFPTWILPASPAARALLLAGLFLYGVLLTVLWRHFAEWLKKRYPSPKTVLPSPVGSWKVLTAGILVLAALHLYPMSRPLTDDDDEAYHAHAGITLVEKTEQAWNRWIPFPMHRVVKGFFLLVLASAGLLHSGQRRLSFSSAARWFFLWGGAILLIALLGLEFWTIREWPHMVGLVRFPPVGKLLSATAYLVFGVHELTVRLIPLGFSVLSGVFLYRLIRLYWEERIACLSALLFWFFPNVFYYAGVAEMASGEVFFLTAVSFYALRFTRDENPEDVLKLLFFWMIGALYRLDVLLLFGAFLLFSFVILRANGPASFGRWSATWIRASFLTGLAILPWALSISNQRLTSQYGLQYELVLSHLASGEILTRLLRHIPTQITWVGTLLSIIGLYFLWKRRGSLLSGYLISWFLAVYLFYTLDAKVARSLFGNSRYPVAFYPVLAVVAALGLSWRPFKRADVGHILTAATLLFLGLSSTVWHTPPLELRYVTYRPERRAHYEAYEEAMRFLQGSFSGETAKIFDPLSSGHFKFYAVKYPANVKWNETPYPEFERSEKQWELLDFCRREGFQYVLSSNPALEPNAFQRIQSFGRGDQRRYLWQVTGG